MSTWSLWVHFFGFLCAFLALAVLTRIAHRRLMPRRACLLGSVIGFSGWAAFVAGYQRAWPEPGSLAATIWLWWCALATSVIPLEAGVLGWFGTRSRWRWFLLGVGLALALVSNLGVILG